MKIETIVIQGLNLTLWGLYCLAYVLIFSSNWNTTTPGLIAYTTICSIIGLVLCATAWQFALGPAVRRARSIDLTTGARLAGTAVALGLVHAFASVAIEPWIFGRPLGPFGRLMAMNFISFVFIYGLVFCFGVLLDLVRRDSDRRERLAMAESRASRAQLMALRLQINPHFVFNALNAVASLIALDRKNDAEEMVHRLSRFVRGVTDTSPHEFSELRAEIELAEEYLAVEAVRFQERLNVVVEAGADEADFLVPNFILQPLVENAVKHGVARNTSTTDVVIRAERRPPGLRLTVLDRCEDPSPVTTVTPGLGIGLANVRDRLRALYSDAAALVAEPTPHGFSVTLDLPEITRDGAAR